MVGIRRRVRRWCAIAFMGAAVLAVLSPAVAQARAHGQFRVSCPYSHSKTDDPIVYPGQPGASHLHDFFGNNSVDAFSDEASLRAATTTCSTNDDLSGYWEPEMYVDGKPRPAPKMTIYYVGYGNTEPMPSGIQMVAGDSHATGLQSTAILQWTCGDGTPKRSKPYNCKPWLSVDPGGVTALVKFPTCWDGNGLTRDHVAYTGRGGVCPAGFGHSIPLVRMFLKTGIINPRDASNHVRISFSSGKHYTLHGDFFSAWTQSRMDSLTQNCINARRNCGRIT
jgi:uncharacterized protein DUF1996